MTPFEWYMFWLSLWTTGHHNVQSRKEQYLAKELEEDIELLEEHGMSLWRDPFE